MVQPNTNSMRNENQRLNLEEYRVGACELKSLPQYVQVELTRGCNLSCPMCRPRLIPIKNARMPEALFQKLAGALFSRALMVDLRGWGESLILPDIENYIRETQAYGPQIRFVTNLSFNRPGVLECLVESGCQVAVSFDAVEARLTRWIRGGADVELVSRNVRDLVAGYRAKYGHAELLYFTTTVQRPALGALADVVIRAAELGVTEVRLSSAEVPQPSPLGLGGAETRVDAALERATAEAKLRGVRLKAGTRLGSMPQNPPDLPPCLHPWAYAAVSFDGQVGFCDHLAGPHGERYSLGSLNHTEFLEIWNGPQWIALRREHLAMRRADAANFAPCSWCYRNRLVDFEDHFDPRAADRIVHLSRG